MLLLPVREGSGQEQPSSIVVTHCLLKWMCSEIYDVLAYNLFWQAESAFKFLTALVEDVSICLQACSSLHALSSSYQMIFTEVWIKLDPLFDPGPNNL